MRNRGLITAENSPQNNKRLAVISHVLAVPAHGQKQIITSLKRAIVTKMRGCPVRYWLAPQDQCYVIIIIGAHIT